MLGESATLLLITLLVFGCGALLFASATRALADRERVRRRYGALTIPDGGVLPEREGGAWLDLDPARLGLDADAQRAIRTELVRAGYFDPGAVGVFAALRIALLVLLPAAGAALAVALGIGGVTERTLLVLALVAVAYALPRAVLARRQRTLTARYRLLFPDYLDMLVVCINAGLGLEAALDRAGRELSADEAEFRTNLDLMAGEMRAGKGTGEALKACAERLGLREARSFAGLLQQTIELGTDVAQALATFSDEMRDKRMSTAEERAAALPPKLTLPLGLFIFPVVLIVVLAPAVLKVASVIGR